MDPTPEDVPSADMAALARENQVRLAAAALGGPLNAVLGSMLEMMGWQSLSMLAGTLGRLLAPHAAVLAQMDYTGMPPRMIEWFEGVKAATAHAQDVIDAGRPTIIQP